ncbi:Adhesion G-protein coupled receptor F3 [Manis javanica]|nr:Adhesion G-protein coupled receptor F3 [Manis javanica]
MVAFRAVGLSRFSESRALSSSEFEITVITMLMDLQRNGTPHCVFWDHDVFWSKGGWSDEGCQVQAASTSPTTQCICRHLTAFSILMSQYTVPENPTLELLTQGVFILFFGCLMDKKVRLAT